MRRSTPTSTRCLRALLVTAVVAAGFAAAGERGARAEDDAEARERCAIRMSIALRGTSPDAQLLTATDPKSEVSRLLASAEFIDRFAAFTNARFNPEPGQLSASEPAYWLTREILSKGKPWADLFVGRYRVEIPDGQASRSDPAVTADPAGLGYFRSEPWLVRYAGNELEGIKITTAYRIMNNVIGLRMAPVTTAPGADVSANGRASAQCRGCHFDGPFALDKVARTLSRVRRRGGISFVPSTDPPQTILDGKTIANDEELVTALVQSPNFGFNACRMAFEFLYGRPEQTCEAHVFDTCMDAFAAEKTMQAALRTVITAPGFCQ